MAYAIPAKGDPGMTLDEMKKFVVDHFEQFVNQKKSAVAYHSFSDDFLDHDEPTGVEVGPAAAQRMMEAAYQRWPDLHVTVEDVIAEGDKVMVRNTWRATEAKDGKKIWFKGMVLWRFAKGKIVERWATITPPTAV
jgi:predicted ester cyclase